MVYRCDKGQKEVKDVLCPKGPHRRTGLIRLASENKSAINLTEELPPRLLAALKKLDEEFPQAHGQAKSDIPNKKAIG
jgi:hypothetical protein